MASNQVIQSYGRLRQQPRAHCDRWLCTFYTVYVFTAGIYQTHSSDTLKIKYT